jgi:hypothetical protein
MTFIRQLKMPREAMEIEVTIGMTVKVTTMTVERGEFETEKI